MNIFIAIKKDSEKFDSFKEIGLTNGIVKDTDLIRAIENNKIVRLFDDNDVLISLDVLVLLSTIDTVDYIIRNVDFECEFKSVPSTNQMWSNKELEAIKTLYPIYSSNDINKILISRSTDSINKKARALSLKKLNVESDEYKKYLKESREYISVKIDEIYMYDIMNIDDMMRLTSLFDEFDEFDSSRGMKLINHMKFKILIHVIKYFSIEDILKYYESEHVISLPTTVFYGLTLGRYDLFEHFENTDTSILDKMYKVTIGINYDGSMYNEEKYNTMFRTFNEFSMMNNNPDLAYDGIKFMLKKVGLNIDNYMKAEKFIESKNTPYIYRLIKFLSNEELFKYLSEMSVSYKYYESSSKNISSILEGRTDDEYLNKIHSKLLANCLYEGEMDDFVTILNMHSVTMPVVLTTELIQLLSMSPKYSEMVSKNVCVIKDDVELDIILNSFISCSISNNMYLAKILYRKITEIYDEMEYENEFIEKIFKFSMNHFKNYNNTAALRMFD